MLVSALEFLDSLNKIMFSKINILCKVWPSFFHWYVCWLQQLPPSEGLSEFWWGEALFWFSLIKARQARKTMWKIKIEKLEPISVEVRDSEMSAQTECKWGTASMNVNECLCHADDKSSPFWQGSCCTVSRLQCANPLKMEQLSPAREVMVSRGLSLMLNEQRAKARKRELTFLHAGKWKNESGLLILPLVRPQFMLCWVPSHPWNCLSQPKSLDMRITGYHSATQICGLPHVVSYKSRKWQALFYQFSREKTITCTRDHS